MRADVTLVFNDNTANGEYMVSLKMKKGTIKKGDKIEGFLNNNVYSFLVKEVQVNGETAAQTDVSKSNSLIL